LRLAAADEFADRLEQDEYDDRAVQILGRDGTRVIATCRLVLPMPDRPLPMEAEFALRSAEIGSVIELGRVVVDPSYRGDGHSVLMGLAGQAWRSMRARGFTRAIGATPMRLIQLFDALGFTVTRLGPPRLYWGEERYPILCEGKPAIPEIERRWIAGEAGTPPATDRADRENRNQ